MTPHSSSILAGLSLIMITKHPSVTKKVRAVAIKTMMSLLEDKEAIEIAECVTGKTKKPKPLVKAASDSLIKWAKGVHNFKIPKHHRS